MLSWKKGGNGVTSVHDQDTAPASEAVRAKREAMALSNLVRETAAEVTEISNNLKAHHTNNHFGDMIQAGMRGK